MSIETALAFHRAGQYAAAREIYQEIINVTPNDYNALHLRGVLELDDNNFVDAITLISKAIKLADSDPAAYNNLGGAYRGLNRLEEAEQCFLKAIHLDNDYAIAFNNLADILILMKRYDEAYDACHKAIDICPNYPDAYNNLGNIMVHHGKIMHAESAYRKALELKPDFLAPYVNLGILFKNSKRYLESKKFYKRALKLNPASDDLLYNLSILELLLGKYRSGFKHYEHRQERIELFGRMNGHIKPWQGESLKGKSLLLLSEQGDGDSLMMMRYTGALKRKTKNGTLGVCCSPRLLRVFAQSSGVDLVISDSESLHYAQFDYFCPIMSLPYLLHTTISSIPALTPYIRVSDEIKSRWTKRIEKVQGMKIGIVWAGNKELAADAKRSISLSLFKPLQKVHGVTLFSLQKGDGADQLKEFNFDIIDFMGDCSDFLDTAALIENLDLVIAVDTAVAHLAGALAKPVWLLCRYESEWRWMHDRKDSPWYPTMTIFRQSSPDDWGGVLLEVVGRLNALGDNHNYYA